MIPRAWTFIGCACLAACGTDVQLGVGPDAQISIDAPTGVFATGMYSLAFLDPIDVMCEGSLTGSEPSFMSITRASANLVDGTVSLVMPGENVLAISGTPIESAFGQPSVSLVPNSSALPPDFPQTIWDTSVTRDFGAGPSSTMQVARYFGVDSATASTPTAMQSAIAMFFQTADTNGDCFVTFAAVLGHQ